MVLRSTNWSSGHWDFMARFCSETYLWRFSEFGSRRRMSYWSDGTWKACLEFHGKQKGSFRARRDTNWTGTAKSTSTKLTTWPSISLRPWGPLRRFWTSWRPVRRALTRRFCGARLMWSLVRGSSSIMLWGTLWSKKVLCLAGMVWLLVHSQLVIYS